MVKLTRGCLARCSRQGRWNDTFAARNCSFRFFAGAETKDITFDDWGQSVWGKSKGQYLAVSDFRKQYALVYQINGKDTGETWPLPRPGQVIEDVWIEL